VFTGECKRSTLQEQDVDDFADSVCELRRRCNELLAALRGRRRGLAVRGRHGHACVQDGQGFLIELADESATIPYSVVLRRDLAMAKLYSPMLSLSDFCRAGAGTAKAIRERRALQRAGGNPLVVSASIGAETVFTAGGLVTRYSGKVISTGSMAARGLKQASSMALS
jgi:hypothetical protein